MSPRPYTLKGQPRRADPEYLARLAAIKAARKARPRRFPDADQRLRERRREAYLRRKIRDVQT
jgi:hypothetical protein